MFNIPELTSDVLAVNFDAPGSPSINIDLMQKHGSSHSLGWGFGWYPSDLQSAAIAKDPTAQGATILTNSIADWSNFRSSVFFCKIRGAESTYRYTETQPFSRSFAGRDWIFMHNGDLDKQALEELHGRQRRLLEPLGTTDSELAFCEILSLLQDDGARQLFDIAPETLLGWFHRFDALGSADMYISDGRAIACYQGTRSPKQLSYGRFQPPERAEQYESPAVRLGLGDPRDSFRTVLVFSSSPFRNGVWTPMAPGQLIIASRGAVVWDSNVSQNRASAYRNIVESHPMTPVGDNANPAPMPVSPGPVFLPHAQPQLQTQSPATARERIPQTPHVTVTNMRSLTQSPDGRNLTYRLFEVTHTTQYHYSAPVEHSSHLFRLQPTIDPIQDVDHSSLTISSPGEEILFEDVFGNQCLHCTIDQPYTDLSVTATSRVKIYGTPPDDHSLSRRQSSIPLIWMPWQRQMMMPYLLPPELPEQQLRELTDYAMSFVERNDYHLLRIVQDINTSIYRDYKYVPGSTSLNTTPFEVFATRQGVCQDFANLFICLAQLLSIPARYRMGYIYTGANYENKIQSDASHAWAEAYLPYVGWRGFDPTNGCTVGQDHIRVACGRNYVDATPTSGTIYKGGGTETLTVDVKMREVADGG